MQDVKYHTIIIVYRSGRLGKSGGRVRHWADVAVQKLEQQSIQLSSNAIPERAGSASPPG